MPPRFHAARSFVLLALAIALPCACRTTTSQSPVSPGEIVVTRTLPTRGWEMWENGRLLGVIVRFEDPADPAKAYFSVRNREQQELGMVDVQGRTWRYRPHEREPEWLGTSTLLEGAQRILGGTGDARLTEVGIDQLKHPSGG